ncbi:MAG: SDR family oxidoreductase [Cytophagaceae bacterium]|jgi:NADP-dependent 3-hydroxy acid dehydrogenase YdfG|nr:SDR family oxidoreductase [Cytophagaceae bacterium]
MKVVLVTGASSGLGETIARYLHAQQYVVYGTSRKIEAMDFPFRKLNMDVCDSHSVTKAVERILSEQGRVDVVINNAGLGLATPFEHVRMEELDRLLDTNIKGVLRVSQAVLPIMRKQGSGKIINVSSIGSELGLPYRGMYTCSKAALDRMTEALRIELKPFGIQACLLQPGGIQTDISKNRLSSPIPDDSPYKESFNRTLQIINDSVSKGLPTEAFGPVVVKLIEAKRLRRKYKVGKFTEKLSVILKGILPSHWFEGILSSHYKV